MPLQGSAKQRESLASGHNHTKLANAQEVLRTRRLKEWKHIKREG